MFEEGDPDIGVNEIPTAVSRAWLSSLSWRYLPSPRLAVTQRLYSTGLDFDNDNRDGATLDTARSTRLGWRADASFAPATRVVVEFGGDAERLDGRSAHRPAALGDDARQSRSTTMTSTRRPARRTRRFGSVLARD